MERKFEYIVEDCLRIGEKAKYTTGIDKIKMIPINPVEGTSFLGGEKIIFTKSSSAVWLLPSKSYLYIEGALTKVDGTPYTRNPQGDYPDITLINNGPMFLFKDISYSLDDLEIEKFTNPGYVTLMHGLMTKSKSYTGLEQFWAIDTYDGNVNLDIIYYPLADFTAADLPFTAGGITAAEYRANVNKIITRFNATNNVNIALLDNAQLPFTAGGQTAAEYKTGFTNLMLRISLNTDGPNIPPLTDAQIVGVTGANLITIINTAINIINKTLVTNNLFLDKNEGFLIRKRLLFNPQLNVVPEANAGKFSFKIPLSFMFNFCTDFDEVITSRKHDLYLQREVLDTFAIIRNDYVDAGKITITKMVWYMPQIIPTIPAQLMLNERIISMKTTDIPYRQKNVKIITVTPGDNNFSTTLSFSGGLKRPSFIICAFQFTPAGVPADEINFAIFNNPKADNANMIDVADATIYIDSDPNPIGYNNNFSIQHAAKWYSDYKEAREILTGETDETNCIDFFDFVNLYRLYVFNTKEKLNFSSGAASITIDFKFNNVIPATATGITKLYVLSYNDNLISLSNDGLDILKKIK